MVALEESASVFVRLRFIEQFHSTFAQMTRFTHSIGFERFY